MAPLGLGITFYKLSDHNTWQFSPCQIRGLWTWLAAGRNITADTDSSGSSIDHDSEDAEMADQDHINAWNDMVNTVNAVQTTHADKPEWDTATADVGGMNMSDGARYMDLSANIAINASQDFSIMMRAKVTDFGAVRGLLGHNSNNLLKVQNAQSIRVIIGGSGTSTWTDSQELADDTYYIFTLTRADGATGNLKMYVKAEGEDEIDWDSGESHTDADAFTISNLGAAGDDANNFQGYIKDVLVYKDVALSAQEREQLYAYIFAQKSTGTDFMRGPDPGCPGSGR